jgi:prolyl 4-hydroxylase
MIQAMRDSGHDDPTIIAVARHLEPGSGPQIKGAGTETTLALPDRQVTVASQLADPEIVVLRDFLSAEECAELIELAKSRLARSTTVSRETGEAQLHHARTSDGAFFNRGETQLIDKIEQRIAALTGWPVENGEGLQVLRYGIGGEYRPHFDYFDPALPGSHTHLARGGQRLGTLLMYLNTPEAGGHTSFPRVGMTAAPIAGHACYFASSWADVIDPRSEHASVPVTKGEKWVATKWLRERQFI